MSRVKLIYGVATNDANYCVHLFESQAGKTKPYKAKKIWTCPFYQRWCSMLARCYRKAYQENRPTYIGCSVTPEWLLFSNFKSWMETQDWEGKHLDKDLLVSGNKIYGPDTCVFLDQRVNSFVSSSSHSSGKTKIGVTYKIRGDGYQASVGNNGVQEYLGFYRTEEEANIAWLKRKAEIAFEIAQEQKDKRVSDALLRLYPTRE